MACFLVPATEAIVTTAISKKYGKEENSRISWLNNMLWGGSALLAVEHVWHGEITPFFPFLTAMNSAEDTAEMLHEMSTVGGGMAVLVTGVWAIMCVVAANMQKSTDKKILKKGL